MISIRKDCLARPHHTHLDTDMGQNYSENSKQPLAQVRLIGPKIRDQTGNESTIATTGHGIITDEELLNLISDARSGSWGTASRAAFKRVFNEALVDPRINEKRIINAHLRLIYELVAKLAPGLTECLYQTAVKEKSGLSFYLLLAASRPELDTYIQALQDGYDLSSCPAVMKSGTFNFQ